MKTCCVTGHREISKNQLEYITDKLKKEIQSAIADGFTYFISGYAEGIDLLFAELVIAEKEKNNNIKLEAAIPYAQRLNNKDVRFQQLIKQADIVHIYCNEYVKDSFFVRNRGMVNMSDRIIAVYDGRKRGGTAYTIGYAQKTNKELRIIKMTNGNL